MKIGFIGSGNIGSNLARLAIKHGNNVIMSNSRSPETLRNLISDLGSHSKAAWAKEAAKEGEIVVVTIPLKNYLQVPVEPLKNKIVIDTMNYYPSRDGHIQSLDNGKTTTSELLQAHLPNSKVVKAFNSIMAGDLLSTSLPKNSLNRRALPIAGNDKEAKKEVGRIINDFGFDVYDVGPLPEGFRFQNGSPAYVIRANKKQLIKALNKA